jgi:prolipoprotein diacylglyceryltransferase
MHDQQLLKRWWIYGIIIAMAISVAYFVFCHKKVRVNEIEKEELGEVKG